MTNYPYDLGGYSWKITTESATAQLWFDRGLMWTYGFHHEEAQVCFERVLKEDPNCAMAYWGLAYIAGPNYNRPWETFGAREAKTMLTTCRDHLAAAKKCVRKKTVEDRLIQALEKRFQSDTLAEAPYEWSAEYAGEMREVYKDFPDEQDVAALFVDAMMNRHPWKLWDLKTGAPREGADTLEARAVLERAMSKFHIGTHRHPGLLHLYIHLMEMSPTPEIALPQADDLRRLVPDAGHLPHMSTHIDVLCGNYQDVVMWNDQGIRADELYWQNAGGLNFYSLYRVHNYHFKLYGAMFLGQFGPAMEAAEGLKRTIPKELLLQKSPPIADWLESYMGIEVHALVRFGKWQMLLDKALPEEKELYCVTTALFYYGKGIAEANLGNIRSAQEMQSLFEEAVAQIPDTRYMHVVSCLDQMGVAREMLAGEIAYHSGAPEIAFDHLREAVKKEDALPYDEPWGWMMPSRHALGALLLDQGRFDEAIDAYEADLGLNDNVIRANRHPNNVWALLGLHRCYEATERENEARLIKPYLDIALARADQGLYASCFCAKS
ncbi:MAG: tetratricopeptide repeat protein [Paracoccaceae bacterium]